MGTFGPEGPRQCSGLPVARYDAEALHGEFGAWFRLVESGSARGELTRNLDDQYARWRQMAAMRSDGSDKPGCVRRYERASR